MRTQLTRRALLGLGLAAVACAPAARSGGDPTVADGREGLPPALRDLAANPARGVYPAAYRALPATTRAAYDYAIARPEVLQYIPCYCGCGGSPASPGHTSNLDCYVAGRRDGGWAILDLHGANCDTCVGITQDVMALERAGGFNLLAARGLIDRKWSGTGRSTPTKLPPGS